MLDIDHPVEDVIAEHMRGLCGYNERGEEIPDSRPVAMPVGFTRPKSLQETMQNLLRNEEFRRALDNKDMESFEEADDFDIEDEAPSYVPQNSPYEQDFDPDGIIAKDQAIRSGFVEEIPVDKKKKAMHTLDNERRRQYAIKKAKEEKMKKEKDD